MTVTPELLLQAYRAGVFPMAEARDNPEIFWVDPRHRGILPLDGFRISRSLARTLRRDLYRVTRDTDFAAVIDGCADRSETWINDEIRALYLALHARGAAHAYEVWQGTELVGGVYGVTLGGAFFGESMFSRARDASKVALAWSVVHLRACGFRLFDTQFITPHLASLGAYEVPRAEYRARLAKALALTADIASQPLPQDGQEVVQRNAQMS